MRTNEIKNEMDEIKKWEGKIKRKDLMYKANKYKRDLQQCETIRSFVKVFILVKLIQTNLKWIKVMDQRKLTEFNDRSRPNTAAGKDKKEILLKV